MISLTINGSTHEIEADPQMPLLFVLRDKLNLVGTKYGCGTGECGACTVLMDGEAVPSCMVPLIDAQDRTVTTIESVAESAWDAVQQAWIVSQVPQCGFCQSGMIMASISLLRRNPQPSRDDVREALSNLCRCGTYPRIEQAVLQAAEMYLAQQTARQAALKERQRERRQRKRKVRSK